MALTSTNNSAFASQRLVGKVALVTGGASGIGESIVRQFHKHGAKVCIADIQDDLGRHLCQTLGGESNACYFHCDVRVEDDVKGAVDFTVEKFGTLDVMINNAGLAGSFCPDIRQVEMSMFDKVFDVNVKGVFHGMKHAARVMIPLKKGSIMSLGSVAGAVAGLADHVYAVTKHAIVGLTKNVAAELGKHGIRVNCVSPYAVPTGMTLGLVAGEGSAGVDAMAAFQAVFGRHANLQGVEFTLDDVANAVVFLASEEARYISGLNLMVDGGFSSVNHSLGLFR